MTWLKPAHEKRLSLMNAAVLAAPGYSRGLGWWKELAPLTRDERLAVRAKVREIHDQLAEGVAG